MFGDTSTGSRTEVQPDIKTMRPKGALQDALTDGSDLEKFSPLWWAQLRKRLDMRLRDDHEMAVVVWIAIQHNKCSFSAP